MRNILLIFLNVFLFTNAAFSEPINYDSAICEYAFEQKLSQFYTREDCSIRSVYSIQLSDDGSMNADVQNAYGDCESILLIEFGCCNLYPIVTSHFACAGISAATGDFEILPTPFELLARVYDPAVLLDSITITELTL